jgi:hypothetical protein
MERKDINTLKRLVSEENVKGKKLLERVIWLNTTKPKYKVGQLVIFSDRARTINGSKVINWVGRIKEVSPNSKEKFYFYELTVKYKDKDGVVKETFGYGKEFELNSTRKKDDVNYPLNNKSEDMIAIRF